MGVQLRFGTAGATGGGFSSRPGELQPSLVERWHEPRWQWQGRSAKAKGDPNRWNSLWSYGCKFGGGLIDGEPIGRGQGMTGADMYEPYSCDGPGCSLNKFIRGTCVDSGGNVVANAIVQGFVTATDAYVGQDVTRIDGSYILGTDTVAGTQHYLVAYKPGSPDTAGTTVNTLTPTNVDGT